MFTFTGGAVVVTPEMVVVGAMVDDVVDDVVEDVVDDDEDELDDAGVVVVGANVVAVVVVGATVVGVVVVVVGSALKYSTAIALLLSFWVLSPSWPKSFRPQHFTSPVGVIAHVCEPPATTSKAPVGKPCTAPGLGSIAPAVERPNWL